MGSYQRFPKTSASSEALRLRDREWREAELYRAWRAARPAQQTGRPRPTERSLYRVEELLAFRLSTLH